MLLKLKNAFVTAEFSTTGAELVRLCDKDNIERLHNGDPKYWERRSPILFPIVSRFVDGMYFYDKKKYKIGTHGFARNCEFNVMKKDDTRVVFKLSFDDQTLKEYPFKFDFYVTYTLFKNALTVAYKVVNIDNKKMYFMCGGHPGFKVPLYDRRERYTDYYLEFEQAETANKTKLNGQYISLESEPFLDNQKTITLKYKMFDPDAYIFKGLKSKYIELHSRTHNKAIRLYFEQFDTLAIWSTLTVDSPFVCIEPWQGLPTKNSVDLENKGILELEPQGNYNISYKIEVI